MRAARHLIPIAASRPRTAPLPFGTKLLITNPGTGKSVTVIAVNDRGPYNEGQRRST